MAKCLRLLYLCIRNNPSFQAAIWISWSPAQFGLGVSPASDRQDAANTIKDEYATSDVTPRLMFRCAPGNPEVTVRIDWQRFISSFNTEIGFKVDDGKTLWLKWGVDRSNKITLSRSAEDSKTLIDHLADGKLLQVEISPYSEGPVIVEYDLTGIASGLTRLRHECA